MNCSQFSECQRSAVARGMCLMHYKRARRTADFKVFRPQGAGLQFLRDIKATDACIEYPHGKFNTGYGHVKVNGRGRTAHAVAYELHIGPIPAGADVCHNCGNRACVNPRHLRTDTHKANMADCIGHGTHTRGSRNGRARLTESVVGEIRTALTRGHLQLELARQFSVSRATISRIARGEAWRST